MNKVNDFMSGNILYITLTGNSSPRSHENVFKIETVTAIIRNKDTGLYFALEFLNDGFGLVGGGVEAGEEKDAAVIREIEEEAGYENAEVLEVIFDQIYARGYKERKDREEEVCDKVYLVEVSEKHKVKIEGADYGVEGEYWFTKEEMLKKLTLDHHVFFFETYYKRYQ